MTVAGAGRAGTAGTAGTTLDIPTGFACSGCGYVAPPDEPVPLRCPTAAAADDVDHVLRRTIDTSGLSFPVGDPEASPFETYRALFHGYHVGRAIGLPDRDYVALVRRFDERVARIDGRGFRPTPVLEATDLGARLGLSGAVLVKDETRNVSGSHKARHLMGTALELELAAALGRARAGVDGPGVAEAVGGLLARVPLAPVQSAPVPLAIASCGNAALAAAVVAAAWGRTLHVYVPASADAVVLERLAELGATICTVGRAPGVPGDPAYRALRRALEEGAVPFTCQGNENGLAIEGGETLGWELATHLAAAGRALDRVFVQVGGGALASSLAQALEEAHRLGALDRLPRIHAVQSRNVRPLVRAYGAVTAHLAPRLKLGKPPGPGASASAAREFADRLQVAVLDPLGAAELEAVPRRRSAFMTPWPHEPHSVAGGILDDETYDWFAVVRAMARTGGFPVAVSEARLREANRLGRSATGIDADHTGTAGLAGLLALRHDREVEDGERVAVLFTGIRRSPPGHRADHQPVSGEPR